MQYSGKIISTVDYGESYGVPDVDGESLIMMFYLMESFFFRSISEQCTFGVFPSFTSA